MVRSCTVLVVAIAASACGRLSFDALGAGGEVDDAGADDVPLDDAGMDGGLPLCLEDTFNDDTADGWTIIAGGWLVNPGAGPDGTTAYVVGDDSSTFLQVDALRSITAVDIELAFRMNNEQTGDFGLALVPSDEPSIFDANEYFEVILFAVGSDDSEDYIGYWDGASQKTATRTSETTPDAWHTLRVLRTGAEFSVWLDGQSYMSTSDARLQEPFDVYVYLYNAGGIDNVSARCAR